MTIKEQDIQREILRFLNIQPGIYAWRAGNRGIFDPKRGIFRKSDGVKGLPDILGVIAPRGTILAIEVKSQKVARRGTPEQELFLKIIRDLGGRAGVARSIDEAREIIES